MWYRTLRTAYVYDPAGQGIFLEEEVPRRFDPSQIQFTINHDSSNIFSRNDGELMAMAGNRLLGGISFTTGWPNPDETYIQGIDVEPEYRKWGIAEAMYRELARYLRANMPHIRKISGNIIAREALQSRVKALGEPLSISDPTMEVWYQGKRLDANKPGKTDYNLEEALSKLSSTDEPFNYKDLHVVHPVRRKR